MISFAVFVLLSSYASLGYSHNNVLQARDCHADNCAREVTGTDAHITPDLTSRLADCSNYMQATATPGISTTNSAIPAYVTPFCQPSEYSSACFCAGITQTTITANATTASPEATSSTISSVHISSTSSSTAETICITTTTCFALSSTTTASSTSTSPTLPSSTSSSSQPTSNVSSPGTVSSSASPTSSSSPISSSILATSLSASEISATSAPSTPSSKISSEQSSSSSSTSLLPFTFIQSQSPGAQTIQNNLSNNATAGRPAATVAASSRVRTRASRIRTIAVASPTIIASSEIIIQASGAIVTGAGDLGTASRTAVKTAATACASPLSSCAGNCTNFQTDATNCGTCGTKCPAGDTCFNGICATAADLEAINVSTKCNNPSQCNESTQYECQPGCGKTRGYCQPDTDGQGRCRDPTFDPECNSLTTCASNAECPGGFCIRSCCQEPKCYTFVNSSYCTNPGSTKRMFKYSRRDVKVEKRNGNGLRGIPK